MYKSEIRGSNELKFSGFVDKGCMPKPIHILKRMHKAGSFATGVFPAPGNIESHLYVSPCNKLCMSYVTETWLACLFAFKSLQILFIL